MRRKTGSKPIATLNNRLGRVACPRSWSFGTELQKRGQAHLPYLLFSFANHHVSRIAQHASEVASSLSPAQFVESRA